MSKVIIPPPYEDPWGALEQDIEHYLEELDDDEQTAGFARSHHIPGNKNGNPHPETQKRNDLVKHLESDWALWLVTLFPQYFTDPFADFHEEFWEHIWSIPQDARPDAFFGIWFRGGAKSTSSELACTSLGARGIRKYALYVCETQEQADDHVANIGTHLESKQLAMFYPNMSDRMVGKFGNVKGWRRNRLRTAAGFTVDAIGLDTAARGVKLDEDRPDLMVFDDLDSESDTVETTDKKVKSLTTKLLPAGAKNLAVIGIQNLVHEDSIFNRIVKGEADFLQNRIVSGPIPAIQNLVTEQNEEGKFVIKEGEPTWTGFNLIVAQAAMDDEGFTAFMSERQHSLEPSGGGMFDHLQYLHIEPEDFDKIQMWRKVCWVDPAVTRTDRSDAMAVSIKGMDFDGKVYDIYAWEHRSTPLTALTLALRMAKKYGCEKVGIETDQGGDTWESVFREAQKATEIENIPMDAIKAGGGHGSKIHRASQMLADYERANIIHVMGTHVISERALKRFPRTKPYDLVDAKFWSWFDLTSVQPPTGIVEQEDRVRISDY